MSFEQLDVFKESNGICMPIAFLKVRAAQLRDRFGITFIDADEKDGLGLFAGSLIMVSGKKFGLVDHYHSPVKGTEVWTNERSVTIKGDLCDFMHGLALDEEELQWVHPKAIDENAFF